MLIRIASVRSCSSSSHLTAHHHPHFTALLIHTSIQLLHPPLSASHSSTCPPPYQPLRSCSSAPHSSAHPHLISALGSSSSASSSFAHTLTPPRSLIRVCLLRSYSSASHSSALPRQHLSLHCSSPASSTCPHPALSNAHPCLATLFSSISGNGSSLFQSCDSLANPFLISHFLACQMALTTSQVMFVLGRFGCFVLWLYCHGNEVIYIG